MQRKLQRCAAAVVLLAAAACCGRVAYGQNTAVEVAVGKSVSVDLAAAVTRVAIANEAVADCVAITSHELLVNGKAPGETSLVVWTDGGARFRYDVTVSPGESRLSSVRREIARELGETDISITADHDVVYVRGTVKDLVAAERVLTIASTAGKAVNLLRVAVPPVEPQVLLNVRFASVAKTVSRDLALNLASGAGNQSSAVGTGQVVSRDGTKTFTLSDAVNLLLFRKDINLVAAMQALEGKRLLEILAEPNLLAINGTQADFVAGGEFPYPVVQPGSNGNSITIAFKEYGIKLGFLPAITPRGTIRLRVAPEVSSLDYTNSVTIAGTVIPGTSTRRVQTEVELESGQSFVIAGLLDRETTDNLSKVPGLASIPLLGKLFQSQSRSHGNTELLIAITPEIVRPIPAGQPIPSIPESDPERSLMNDPPLRHPAIDQTGPVPVQPAAATLPAEMLLAPPGKSLVPVAPKN